jgi:Tfp pilus assembly protein PilO
MRSLSRAQLLVLGLVGIVVMTFLWWQFFYKPATASVGRERTALTAEQSRKQSLDVTLKHRQDLKRNEPVLDQHLADIHTWLPDDPQLAEFIEELTRIARESGIEFVSLSSGQPQAGAAGQGEVSFGLSGQAGFFQLLDYLVRLEKLPRTTRVDNIALSPQVKENGTVTLGVTVQGRVFMSAVPAYLSLPPSATTAPAPVTSTAPSASLPATTGTVTGATTAIAPRSLTAPPTTATTTTTPTATTKKK